MGCSWWCMWGSWWRRGGGRLEGCSDAVPFRSDSGFEGDDLREQHGVEGYIVVGSVMLARWMVETCMEEDVEGVVLVLNNMRALHLQQKTFPLSIFRAV